MVEPTEGQKRAADNIIAMKMVGRVNKKKALLDAGYSLRTAENPKLVTESKGFIRYMEESGITEESLAKMLCEDLYAKPKERLGEMKFAAELMGLTNKDMNINVRQSDENIKRMESIIKSINENNEARE